MTNPVVDLAIYRKYNVDLSQLNDAKLKKHYTDYGRKEGRIANQSDVDNALTNFDPDRYRGVNGDLSGLDNEAITIHWLQYGRREGRSLGDPVPVEYLGPRLDYILEVDFSRVLLLSGRIQQKTSAVSKTFDKEITLQDLAVAALKQVFAVSPSDKDATRRYLFRNAFVFLVEKLYQSGKVRKEDFETWTRYASLNLGYYDIYKKQVIESLHGCGCF